MVTLDIYILVRMGAAIILILQTNKALSKKNGKMTHFMSTSDCSISNPS